MNILKVLALILVSFLAIKRLPAQTAVPSYEVTIAWLKEKINNFAVTRGEASDRGDRTIVDMRETFVSADDCVLKTRYESNTQFYFRNSALDPRRFVTDVEIDLTDLDFIAKPDVNNSYSSVTAYTKRNRVRFSWDDRTKVGNAFTLHFGKADNDNEELAERIKKAFENLITLCKDKRKPSNEPF